jgi:hypothetical protein
MLGIQMEGLRELNGALLEAQLPLMPQEFIPDLPLYPETYF